jgi:hypothetical protein
MQACEPAGRAASSRQVGCPTKGAEPKASADGPGGEPRRESSGDAGVSRRRIGGPAHRFPHHGAGWTARPDSTEPGRSVFRLSFGRSALCDNPSTTGRFAGAVTPGGGVSPRTGRRASRAIRSARREETPQSAGVVTAPDQPAGSRRRTDAGDRHLRRRVSTDTGSRTRPRPHLTIVFGRTHWGSRSGPRRTAAAAALL